MLLTAAWLLLVAVHHVAAEEAFKCGMFEPPGLAPSFSLQASNGARFKLSDARGKVVALAFGFTYCARICPTTLSTLARVKEKLGHDADLLQVVFVTVDPERDSVARLQEFVSLFDPSFLGVTGTAAELAAVRNAYGIAVNKEDHVSSILLIDREGKLRLFAPFGKPPGDLVHDIKLLLQ